MAGEIIVGQSENSYFVLTNGQVTAFKSSKTYDELYAELLENCRTGVIQLKVKDHIRTCLIVSPNQHFSFTLMTEAEFNKWQTEQRYAAAQAGHLGGR